MTSRPLVLLSCLALLARASVAGEPPHGATGSTQPVASLPYTPTLEPAYLDRSANPCENFYQFACGGWIAKNPIPADQSFWSASRKASDENRQFLLGLLQESSRALPGRGVAQQKIGDYFASCMDEAESARLGVAPLQPLLHRLSALSKREQLAGWLAEAQVQSLDERNPLLFGFGATQDPGQSDRVIAWLVSGGIGLGEREEYLQTDSKAVEVRERYQQHIRNMLRLLGKSERDAAKSADTVLRIETYLAGASLDRTSRRDPRKIFHRMSLPQLQALMPSFAWREYWGALGAPAVNEVNVTEPQFFTALESLIHSESLDTIKTYLHWALLTANAAYLSPTLVQEDFAFFRSYLGGVRALPPRWKQCVAWTDRDLGEALGQVFVEKVFSPSLKAQATTLVQGIAEAMASQLQTIDWMGVATRQEAQRKLATLRYKIGYPDHWRDYSSLQIQSNNFLGNVQRAALFENRRQLAKIGQPISRDDWEMSPPTVNAYYHPLLHEMNFPAGELLPPHFDPRLDAAPNYGNIGAVIGHELIHAFDDAGRQYDAHGNLKDWWTTGDAQEFNRRANCLVKQFDKYIAVGDIKINGRLTLGENVADLGGLRLAYLAWQRAVQGQKLSPRDGLTPAQRFFVGFGQWGCAAQTEQSLRSTARSDSHAPYIYRVNGTVSNLPEFAQAFACPAGSPMARQPVCKLW